MSISPSQLKSFFDRAVNIAASMREAKQDFAELKLEDKAGQIDWSRLRALAVAYDADQNDEKKHERVEKLVEKAGYATWYAEILKLGVEDEQKVEIRSSMPAASARAAGIRRPNSSSGSTESRRATANVGVSYSKAQANRSPSTGSYRSTGEDAPAGPSAESVIETAGVATGPLETSTSLPDGEVTKPATGEPVCAYSAPPIPHPQPEQIKTDSLIGDGTGSPVAVDLDEIPEFLRREAPKVRQ